MNVQPLEFSKADALVALRAYREHRGNYDAQDREIERAYRAIARGGCVISACEAIVAAGFDAQGRPRLALSRADAQQIRCHVEREQVRFDDTGFTRWTISIPWTTGMQWSVWKAMVPRIPPQHRPPRRNLRAYWLLWEAEWSALPRDPYLLRRIGRDVWIVLAAWELTPVELAVLKSR